MNLAVSNSRQYRVEVSEWGMRSVVIIRAASAQAAIAIAKQKARKEIGWEGIRSVHGARLLSGRDGLGGAPLSQDRWG
jgi:hypothetical protein